MMVKGTGRKCSCCGHNGHNSRTCNGKVTNCIKLFGANIAVMDGDRDPDRNRNQQSSIQRSFSMGNLQFHGENKIDNNGGGGGVDNGYLSDGPIHSKRHKAIHEVKRGKPWTEEEHRMFLEGLKNLGKGDWRGISKNYVTTRTPVQVASHAQKYFLRHQPALNDRKKRRQSLFDMPFQQSESNECPWGSSFSEEPSTRNSSQIVSQFPHLSVGDRPATSMTASPSFPTYYQMFQPMSLLFQHRMNYAGPHHGYIGNALPNVAVCAPADHPSPRSVQDKMFQEGRGDSSSTEKDLLELKIAPPQSSSSQPFIRVI